VNGAYDFVDFGSGAGGEDQQGGRVSGNGDGHVLTEGVGTDADEQDLVLSLAFFRVS